MVEQIDLDDCASLFEKVGNLFVGVAWLNITRRVVMDKNDGVGALFNGGFENLTRVNEGGVKASCKNNLNK